LGVLDRSERRVAPYGRPGHRRSTRGRSLFHAREYQKWRDLASVARRRDFEKPLLYPLSYGGLGQAA